MQQPSAEVQNLLGPPLYISSSISTFLMIESKLEGSESIPSLNPDTYNQPCKIVRFPSLMMAVPYSRNMWLFREVNKMLHLDYKILYL
jgi:hypothetical protein